MTSAAIAARPALVVLAKRPVPGRVKTRLTPPFTPAEAAALAAAALTDTLDTVDATPAPARLLSFAGDAEGWLRPGWTPVAQPDTTLDLRISHAFAAVGHGPALLVGMDTPQLTRALLEEFDPLRFDAALGPAGDGGYWAIGFRDARAATGALPGVPMSTSHTGAAQLARLRELGLRVQELSRVDDVDTADDAARAADQAPASEFARVLRSLRIGVDA